MGPTQKTGFGAGARIGTVENINKNNFQKRKEAEKDIKKIWIFRITI
jgi:ribosomal protein L20